MGSGKRGRVGSDDRTLLPAITSIAVRKWSGLRKLWPLSGICGGAPACDDAQNYKNAVDRDRGDRRLAPDGLDRYIQLSGGARATPGGGVTDRRRRGAESADRERTTRPVDDDAGHKLNHPTSA